jgi:hypothetical protein
LTAVRTYNVKTEEIPNILNQLIAAGHAGGFTLERMADFLPQQMARAAESGMGGRADFAALAALNQAAFRSSGNQEEAGQSVRTILGLMNDKSVADQIKRTTGVNLPKYLQSQREQGVSSIDAFAGLLQRQVEKNSSYKTLQAKLATAKNDDERSATLESMAAIAQRSSIGNFVTNRRTMMAILSMLNEQGYTQDVRRTLMDNDVAAGGARDKDLEVIRDESNYKTRQAGESGSIAQQEAMRGINEKIGDVAQQFGELAGKYPGLVGGMTTATAALVTFSGSVGMATLALRGAGVGGRGPGGGAGGRGGLGSKLGRGALMRGAGRLAAGGVLAAAGSMAAGYALEKGFGEESAVTRYGTSALNGAGFGATVGSIIAPGIGTAIGAAIGGAGGLIYQGISDWMNSNEAKEIAQQQQQEQPPVSLDASLQIGLAPGLVLQGQTFESSGGNIKMSTGNIFSPAF